MSNRWIIDRPQNFQSSISHCLAIGIILQVLKPYQIANKETKTSFTYADGYKLYLFMLLNNSSIWRPWSIFSTVHTCQLSRIRHRSSVLPYGSPSLSDKIIFWSFLFFSLRCSPFFPQNLNFSFRSTVPGTFSQVFSHWQRLFRHQTDDSEFW